MNKSKVQLQICPLCGKDNQCAVAAGQNSGCWCQHQSFDRQLLESQTGNEAMARCICQNCVEQAGEDRDAG